MWKKYKLAREEQPLVRLAEGAGALVFALALWTLAAHLIDEAILLPTPLDVFKRLVRLLAEPEFPGTVLFSFTRIAGGFFGGLLLGILLATVAAAFFPLEILLRPFLFTVKSVPVASFIVLALFWFSSEKIALVISFLMVLPIVYTNILEGIRSTDPRMLEMAEVYRLSFSRRFAYLYVPAIKPYLMAACRVSLGLAWKAGVAAEVIGLPDGSLGGGIYLARQWVETDTMLAYTVVIVIVSLLFEKLVLLCLRGAFRLWERL